MSPVGATRKYKSSRAPMNNATATPDRRCPYHTCSAMRKVLRFLLLGLVVVVVLAGALFGYFVYSPAPEVPRLSGALTRGTIEIGGLTRTYKMYVPRGLPRGAPLVVLMHGA